MKMTLKTQVPRPAKSPCDHNYVMMRGGGSALWLLLGSVIAPEFQQRETKNGQDLVSLKWSLMSVSASYL